MAKARQVGTPHSLQFVLGNSLKIWIPVSPMVYSFPTARKAQSAERYWTSNNYLDDLFLDILLALNRLNQQVTQTKSFVES
jgi:hypothetical protein